MFISHKYRFIFIKTRKTAGSSLEKFFLNIHNNNKEYVFGGMPPENLSPINCVGNVEHKGWKWIEKHFSNEWGNYFKFAIERNSWDKVVSTYHWQKKQIPNMKHNDFTSYILNGKKMWDKKDWNLYTNNDKICVDKIIRFENINEEFRSICKYLEIPYNNELENLKLKENIRPKDNYKNYYNEETKQIIKNVFSNEINYFQYTF